MYKIVFTKADYQIEECGFNEFRYEVVYKLLELLKDNEIIAVMFWREKSCVFSFSKSEYTVYSPAYDLFDDEMIALIHDAIRNR